MFNFGQISSLTKELSALEHSEKYNFIRFPPHFYSDNFKITRSATVNIFEFFYFLFKSFVIVELSYVFTINMFTIIAENCTEK